MSENLHAAIESLEKKIEAIDEKRHTQHIENLVQLTRIAEAIKHNDACIDDMKRKLFGPEGNTGVIGIMQDRIGSLEKTLYRAIGAVAALLTLLNVAAVLQKFIQ